ncbi:hypothetical protein YC2023_009771 [Brassica napus]
MTNDNNTLIDVTTTPLNVAATDATVTTVANITASTAAATTSTILPAGNAADETTRRSLFGAGLYQTGSVSAIASGPVAVKTPPAVPSVFTQGLMPDKFDGKGFKTWQKKMMFFLITMKLDNFIQEDKPLIPYGIDDVHSLATVDIWVPSDYICKGYVLGRLIDPLYRVYCEIPTAKELWRSLDKKYRGEDAGCQKYVVSKFHDFKMVDSKPIMDQVEALQLICHEIAAEGMSICETFTTLSFIEKLPPSYADFKNYLKHKKKKMGLEELIMTLQMESRNRTADKVTAKEHSVNMVEHKGKGKAHANTPAKPSKTSAALKASGKNFKNKGIEINANVEKFKGKCHYCQKVGHKTVECRKNIKDEKAQANLTEEDLVAVVTEANMVESNNPKEWWYDTGATTHICTDRAMFSTYQKSETHEKLRMGNTAVSKIEGRGNVILKMTSGREVTLTNVKHVPDMRKNLVSGTLFSKNGFAISLEADKLVIRKNEMYLGKGYVKGGLVKLNVMTVLPKVVAPKVSMKKKESVAYLVESFNIWYERLGHVNYKSIQRLMNLNLIPKYKTSKQKCEVCVQAKLTKTPSPRVERTNKPLDLIHTDLCDLKYIQTRGGKKYFVTFIDDCSKYCYVYLLHSKDETLEKFKEFKLEVENQLKTTIKVVRSDRGGEYDSPFNAFCKEHGIIHQTTAPYSPESNGVAERKNRTLKEMMNAMLQESGLPQNMWGGERYLPLIISSTKFHTK